MTKKMVREQFAMASWVGPRKLRDCEDGSILYVHFVDSDGNFYVSENGADVMGVVYSREVHDPGTGHFCTCYLHPQPARCTGRDCYEWIKEKS